MVFYAASTDHQQIISEFIGKWYTMVKARKIDLLPSSNEIRKHVKEVSPKKEDNDLDDFLNDDVGELPF